LQLRRQKAKYDGMPLHAHQAANTQCCSDSGVCCKNIFDTHFGK
jgi:hypothetical protein